MKRRCLNPNYSQYKDYGGRGIIICERWLVFENFLADMGERPRGATLERVRNEAGYEPGNCRWATRQEQNRNSRHNRLISFNGITQPLVWWAEQTGNSYEALINRLRRNWPLARVLSPPMFKRVRGQKEPNDAACD